ncbi:MAG: enoyl-CoA hydratase/isomerase family protein [Propionibacteriaceae bacterium]|jgi:enoyl-CoA hydratase/carnithine racemase|nr:enoyl-CoA hydratase/isomerase family protein [Propionibacteriaceae bacterium]
MAPTSTPQYEQLTLNYDGAVATITLNNPNKRNALSESMMNEITAALREVGTSDTLLVVLAANGSAFSAGHNLADLVDITLPQARKLFRSCVNMIETIQGIPQPVIAKVHAVAAAGGCQLVASCDLVVAADTATFSIPGIKRGLFCHTPLVAVSRNVGAKHALEMALTGDSITAATAEQWGLINYAVPATELDSAVDKLIHRIIDDGSPYARSLGKKLFYDQLGVTQASAYDLAAEVVALNAVLPDAQEGFVSFVEKRQPVYKMLPNG